MNKNINKNENWELFIKKAEEFNINLTAKQIEQFQKYWQFLYEYNKHTNLVSSAELDLVASKHFADSLSIGLLENELSLNSSKTVLDIGIGGGFPGVPIIIAYPDLKLYAVDSVGKKTDFISKLSEELGLNDRIEVINSRAEELIKQPNKQEFFDIAVSRAVSRLNILLEYTLPFVKVGGFFIAYKAKTFQEEINESKQSLSILGGEVIKIADYTLSNEERKLLLIKKTKPTPEKYPRKTGIPAKNPL
ncbi:MAG: hypothetical protein A2039_06075 [Candidatus Melainabacteria bacterium GWA2_34_9]|nr:MAG: hypothetical protein A2039_06075 [Candidatus Melainabacteria bacterium GWA2_34_9]